MANHQQAICETLQWPHTSPEASTQCWMFPPQSIVKDKADTAFQHCSVLKPFKCSIYHLSQILHSSWWHLWKCLCSKRAIRRGNSGWRQWPISRQIWSRQVHLLLFNVDMSIFIVWTLKWSVVCVCITYVNHIIIIYCQDTNTHQWFASVKYSRSHNIWQVLPSWTPAPVKENRLLVVGVRSYEEWGISMMM